MHVASSTGRLPFTDVAMTELMHQIFFVETPLYGTKKTMVDSVLIKHKDICEAFGFDMQKFVIFFANPADLHMHQDTVFQGPIYGNYPILGQIMRPLLRRSDFIGISWNGTGSFLLLGQESQIRISLTRDELMEPRNLGFYCHHFVLIAC